MTTPAGSVSDVEINTGDLGDDATDAFLKSFIAPDPDKPASEEGEKDTKPATPAEPKETEGSEPEAPETSEDEGEEDKPTTKKYVEDDGIFVKVKVGEEEHEVPVKDLRRLFGQEAALTKKSQVVAEAQRKADQETAKALASLDVLLKRAQERSKPFRELDFLQAAKSLSDDDLKVLRTEAQRAFEEETFLQNELNGFMQTIQVQQHQARAATAQQTIKTLADQASPYYIEGWNQKTYDELRHFAIGEGLDANLVNNIIEAPALKLLHMAMQYKKGASKTVTQKTKKTPTKIVKTSQSPAARAPTSVTKKKEADARLRREGSQDAAVDAFLARMTAEE